VEEAQAFLASRLEGLAEVRKVTSMMDAGYFGPIISPKLRGRAGDLVILPTAVNRSGGMRKTNSSRSSTATTVD